MLRVELEKEEYLSYLYLYKKNIFFTIDSFSIMLKTLHVYYMTH